MENINNIKLIQFQSGAFLIKLLLISIVIIVISLLILRIFMFGFYRIPSASMLPTLQVGDYIMINKSKYGVYVPFTRKKIVDVSQPERGDLIVFRYPPNPQFTYIKRLIGLPGDKISYKNKQLIVNDRVVKMQARGEYSYVNTLSHQYTLKHFEVLLDENSTHNILLDSSRRDGLGRSFIVPESQYFVMGDNRDYSADSRVWGFVAEDNIIGKAFYIWLHWDNVTDRGVNWQRVGAID